eukprot:TRINITY_DN5662_c0_g3_i1.p1 TRINITY_DN5662_c0_g3~~TRINITY_DN5662_c0_g3_i1.p1  ORF type:complete len:270 (+),score=74.84 TRINITY_DN5662_c0_g3_i1:22-810(+)
MAINVSIIVPAYEEAANIKQLTTRLFKALKEQGIDDAELIIVDDNSPDNTKEVCAEMVKEGYPLRLITRTTERGLSSAVLRGFAEGKGSYLLCMDADLQHPPESVPDMISALRKPGTDFVLGTRYGANGGVSSGWPLHRRIISWGARMLARPLSPLSDPMSGFFGVRREPFEKGLKHIDPIGYKIALEIYVKSRIRSNALEEVSFLFGTRQMGASKLTGKVIVHYLLHLRKLYLFEHLFLVILLISTAIVFMCFAAGYYLLP